MISVGSFVDLLVARQHLTNWNVTPALRNSKRTRKKNALKKYRTQLSFLLDFATFISTIVNELRNIQTISNVKLIKDIFFNLLLLTIQPYQIKKDSLS